MSNSELIVGLLLALLSIKYRDPIMIEDPHEEYDFVIIGAGTTGAVVAGRLSEHPNTTVLLLESGPSDLEDARINMPYYSPYFIGSNLDWGYEIVKQSHGLQGYHHPVKLTTGKVLGGSSSINAATYARGSPHDFNSWEAKGATGWSWKDVEPYFRKLEGASDEGLSNRLGREGPLKISHKYVSPLGQSLVDAADEIGLKPVDYMEPDIEGVSKFIYGNVYKGIRQSSTTAYIRTVLPDRADRLHVGTSAHVTKILFDKTRASGIEYRMNGKSRKVSARKEIIISAGFVGTPHLLMLSGIGPANHLKDMNIELVSDLPGVGSNLQDHLLTLMPFIAEKLPEGAVVTEDSVRNSASEYIKYGKGPLTNGFTTDVLIYAKSKYSGTDKSESSKEFPFPDLNLFGLHQTMGNGYLNMKRETNEGSDVKVTNFTIGVNMIHPKSRGTIRLQSSDPLQPPLIDPNYLSDKDDVTVLIESFRILENIENAEYIRKIGAKLLLPPFCNSPSHVKVPRSNKFYSCLIRKMTGSSFHQCCSAKMGSKTDKMAVVDSRLRVYGVEGLRIADASVMPHEVSGNPAASCIMIGEKVADMVKEDWNIVQ